MLKFVQSNDHKGFNRRGVYILQVREIMERRQSIGLYRVHVKLPYLFPLPGGINLP